MLRLALRASLLLTAPGDHPRHLRAHCCLSLGRHEVHSPTTTPQIAVADTADRTPLRGSVFRPVVGQASLSFSTLDLRIANTVGSLGSSCAATPHSHVCSVFFSPWHQDFVGLFPRLEELTAYVAIVVLGKLCPFTFWVSLLHFIKLTSDWPDSTSTIHFPS
ncbi:hypothetical protein NDU88_001851 [Pleurodeles waltl]|uniref:Secreted protein n=1 Tax=Pleurodeles waltl TaxID=8319 RepID=A0AAV7MMW2_PLEWA|nr:hypothetical protein NDU88_001851 [Pleurodeles waltl]